MRFAQIKKSVYRVQPIWSNSLQYSSPLFFSSSGIRPICFVNQSNTAIFTYIYIYIYPIYYIYIYIYIFIYIYIIIYILYPHDSGLKALKKFQNLKMSFFS